MRLKNPMREDLKRAVDKLNETVPLIVATVAMGKKALQPVIDDAIKSSIKKEIADMPPEEAEKVKRAMKQAEQREIEAQKEKERQAAEKAEQEAAEPAEEEPEEEEPAEEEPEEEDDNEPMEVEVEGDAEDITGDEVEEEEPSDDEEEEEAVDDEEVVDDEETEE